MNNRLQDLLENPTIAVCIIEHLIEMSEDIEADLSAIQEAFPTADFSITVAKENGLINFNEIKKRFSLYPKRSSGKKSANLGVYSLDSQRYRLLSLDSPQDKHPTGFMVTIPVPYLSTYTKGQDRHPVTIIKKYLKAIFRLNKDFETLSEEQLLDYARQRIRILIGLNVKDDHYDPKQKTATLRREVLLFSRQINKELRRNQYPAWVVPILWGLDAENGQELYHDAGKVNWLNSHVDKVRGHIKHTKVDARATALLFPFASVRSFLIESRTCQTMLSELEQSNTAVYHVTGDADVISLHPEGKNSSIFTRIAGAIESAPETHLIRLGGAYGFANDDIAQHVQLHAKSLNANYLAKSILMTQLLHCLDIATRKIFAMIDPALAYYSEIHTYTASAVFDQKGEKFKRKGRRVSDAPLTETARNSFINEPDFTAHVSKAIIQDKNWRTNAKPRRQMFVADRAAQLLTSARHDIIIIKPAKLHIETTKHVQVLNAGKPSMEALQGAIAGQHNNQLSASQLNSRFREAGYGDNAFHEALNLLRVNRFPFVVFFLTDRALRTKRKEARGDKNSDRIAAAKKEISLTALCSAGFPERLTFDAIYHALLQISAVPESLLTVIPNMDIVAMRSIGASNKFSIHRKAVIKAFFQIEYLLRWVLAMSEKISRLDEEYKPASSTIKTKHKDTFTLFGAKKRSSQCQATALVPLADKFNSTQYSTSIFAEQSANEQSDNHRTSSSTELEASLLFWQMNYAIERQRIPGDGACQYHAVAFALNQLDEPTRADATVLKSKAIEYIQQNRARFESFISSEVTQGVAAQDIEYRSIDDYLQQHESADAHGDHLTLQALAEVIKHDIVVLQPNSQSAKLMDINFIRQSDAANFVFDEALIIIFNGVDHYDAVMTRGNQLFQQVVMTNSCSDASSALEFSV